MARRGSRQCKQIKADGARCQANAITGSDYCFAQTNGFCYSSSHMFYTNSYLRQTNRLCDNLPQSHSFPYDLGYS